MKKSLLLFILLILSAYTSVAQNLLINGDFEGGGNGTGFNTSGAGYNEIISPFAGVRAPGDFALVANPFVFNPAYQASADHTTGAGKMLVVDGLVSAAGQPLFWQTGNAPGGNVCGLIIGRKYQFSYWVKSVSSAVINPATQAEIKVLVSNSTGLAIVPTGNSAFAPLPAQGWKKTSYTFTASAACVTIGMYNNTPGLAGNDFAIDDLSLLLLPSATLTGNKTTCKDSTPPPLRFTGANGVAPYTFNYTIDGAPFSITTITGNFIQITAPTNAVGSSVYELVSVTDSAGLTQTYTGTTIVITIVNSLTATITANQTICPNTTATFNLTGTPTATVVVLSSDGNIYNVVLDAAGLGTLVTPQLTEDTTYSIQNVNTFPNGCLTVVTGVVKATIVANGCATVLAGDVNLDDVPAICTVGDVRRLKADYVDLGTTTAYAVTQIDYCPQAAFTGLPGAINNSSDDVWTPLFNLPFNFCFFGNSYNKVTVGGNGMISFNTAYAGNPSGYTITADIPSPAVKLNSIFGVFQDTDPSNSPPEYEINYVVLGTYPCRKLIINFYHLGQFSCGQSAGLQTSQVVLYEISNIIEVYVESRTPCNSWEGGRGLIGIQNATGTLGYAPPGRNRGNWSAFNEAWRFTPAGPSAVTFQWLENGLPMVPPQFSTTLDVAPTVTTNYTAEATYRNCGNPDVKILENVTVTVIPDGTGNPSNITQCPNTFDLSVNTPAVLGALDPFDYEIRYFLTNADAIAATNEITNLTAFVSSGQTIYMSILNVAGNCFYIRPFDLVISCTVTPVQPPDLVECDGTVVDGKALFNFTPQNAIILGANPAANFNITYHVSAADATADINPIGPSYTNVTPNTQTIYVRMEEAGNPAAFGTTSFNIIVRLTPAVPNPADVFACTSYTLPALPVGSTYHSASGGNAATIITGPITTTQTVWIFAQAGTAPNVCSAEGDFIVTIGIVPSPVDPGDKFACDTYALPALPAGSTYHTASGGAAGTLITNLNITTTQTVWIFAKNGTAPNICTAEVDFLVTITTTPTTPTPANQFACTSYTLPALPAGSTYHSAAGGSPATVITGPITTSQTVWIFAQAGTAPNICSSQGSFTVTIVPVPTPVDPGDKVACDSFTLPALPAGSTYHSASGGAAGTLITNLNITSTQTVWIFAKNGTAPNICTAEVDFLVTITPTPNTPTPANQFACTSYTLPALPAGSTYHSAAGGSPATIITGPITTSQTVWIFAQAGTAPNICSSQGSFTVTIVPLPTPVDPGDKFACDTFTLPALPAGSTYHSASGGAAGTLITNLNITSTQTIWIFAKNGTAPNICTAEVDFVVTITPTPITPTPANQFACDSFTLPALPAGSTYHSASGGNAATIITGPITTTQTVWIFAKAGTAPNICSAEGSFVVTIVTTPTPVDPGDSFACDTFALPALPAGSTYHTASGGAAGTLITNLNITSTQTIWIFAKNGTAPNICTAEVDFIVTIEPTPATPNPSDQIVCDSYTLPALPAGSTYHSASGGNASTVITGPITTTQTVWIYAQNGTAPNICSAEGDFLVTVNNTPQADAPVNVFSCNSYTLPILSVGNYFSATNGGGTPYFAGDVITSDIRLFVYASTGTTPNCFTENSFDIVINTPPVITTPSDIESCDDNNDGFAEFTLSSSISQITGGLSNLVVSFHETATDAINNANPISILTNYTNIVPSLQIINVRVSDVSTPNCASYTTLNLIVNPVPVFDPAGIPDYPLCDDNAPTGTEGFTLSTMDTVILNGQLGVTISYYQTQADAQTGLAANAINKAIPFESASGLIWVRLQNSISGCFVVKSFNLVVNPLPVVVQQPPVFGCSNGATGTAEFDLSLYSSFIAGNATGVQVTYYLTLANAISRTNAIGPLFTNTLPNTQTIFVNVLNTTTGCDDTGSFVLNITQGPRAVAPPALVVCDPNSDGFASFNLSDADIFVSGGTLEPGVSITYHETNADALTGANPKTGNYTNIVPDRQIMYVRVLYTADPRCINIVELELLVNPTPQATEIAALEECSVIGNGTANFDLTQATAGILNGLDPLLYTVSYYVSQAAANTGTGAITNVLAFNSPSAQIWVRLEDNATGCFDVIALDLQVNDLPIAPLVAALPYSKCDDNNPGDGQEVFDLSTQLAQILNGQTGMIVTFHFSDADAQAGQNPLPNLYTNVVNAQTIHVRIENSDTGCFVVTTMDLRVEPLPTLIPPDASLTTICDFNGDGFGDFDLSLLSDGILQGAPGVTISYHETLVDAQVGVRDITGIYTNVNAFFQPIYVRAENNTTGCWNVIMIELTVIASPIVPVTPDQTICDEDDADGQDGYAQFDLTRDEAAMLANQGGNPANYTVEYFISSADADLGTSPIINATTYINTTPLTQEIWVRVSDVNNTCYNKGSFTINVNLPLALPVSITPLTICDDGPTSVIPQRAFDLTIRDVLITGGLPGYTVTYYPSNIDAANNTNVITNPSSYVNIVNPQTLGVMVTSPDGCRSYTIMDIRVIQLPVVSANNIPVIEVCAGDQVDLTQNETLIKNNDPGLSFTYYPTLADLENRTNAIGDPEHYVATGNVFILVTNNQVDYLGNNCFIVVVQPIKVNALPLVGGPVVLKGCDANLNGFEFFDLNDANQALLGATQDPADYTITFYESQANAQSGTNPIANPGNYENTSNPQDVYVRIVDNTTGCVNATGVVTLNVLAGAATSAVDFVIAGQCDNDGTNDGLFAFDLTQFETEILNGQDPALFTVNYFATLANATRDTLAIAMPEVYLAGTGKAFAVVKNNATECRSRIVEIDLLVEPLAEPVILTIDQSNTICVDFVTGDLIRGLTLTSSITGAAYTYQWFYQGQPIAAPLGTSSSYLIDTATGAGEYGLVVTSTTALLCPSEQAVFTVIKSGPPVLRNPAYVVTGAFSDLQTIVATVDGFGEYVYALDDGPWMANNGIFENVSAGGHTIRIMDANVVSCGQEIIQAIRIIDYPRYFTPNGDGIHDTWNIIGLGEQENARIYIFDRYGKLLKQIAPNPEGQGGWDGTYNGHPLPSTDYWFMVEYLEPAADGTLINKEFRAHFSLKR